MVTALVLQLIQCSVKIPEKADEMQDAASAEDGADENKPQVSSMTKMYMRMWWCCCQSIFFFSLQKLTKGRELANF